MITKSKEDMAGWVMSEHGVPDSRLTVVEQTEDYVDKDGRHYIQWKCICSCQKDISYPKYTNVLERYLKNGRTKSCGCLQRESAKKLLYKHGDGGNGIDAEQTRLYRIWAGMKNRCNNPNNKSYKHYGTKGVSVVSEWNEYLNFKKWAIDNGYKDNLTIDRIDVNGNYSPDNCRWVTIKEQENNRSNNRLLKIDGVVKTLAEWSEEYNINYSTVESRLRRGWDVKKAMTTPVKFTTSNKKKENYNDNI